jgi:homoserine O-acetyltransferase
MPPPNPIADAPSRNSVGVVETRSARIPLPPDGLRLQKGGVLRELTVAYETYGERSAAEDNVVLVCHALTGDAHVAGFHAGADKPGWWEEMVGPGKGIDTDYYHVVCSNILGGCAGTTGPSSPDPETGRPYGSSFPDITVADIVRVQRLLLEHLGIRRLAAVIGGSLGGMQVLEWGLRHPDKVERCICVASGASLSTQALAFDIVAREAIESDPTWRGGDYYGAAERGAAWGLAHARKIGHITYLSPGMMQEKFGRERVAGEDAEPGAGRFQVHSYLDHQGRKLVERFDANSYIHITRAMDEFDLEKEFGSLREAFAPVQARFLVIGLSSDWLFPPEQSRQLADALLRAGKPVSCCTLKAPHGHDAFLVDIEKLTDTVRAFLPWVKPREPPPGASAADAAADRARRQERERREHRLVVERVRPHAKVLDLGCGDGTLLTKLAERKHTVGMGMDIALANVIAAINRGHDVFQGDLDEGLPSVAEGAYDYAILGAALQEVRRPRLVLTEMVRVAREGIVTFPNFAHWRNRLHLATRGTMPKSPALPFEWYETPNIHLATRNDFVALCRREGIRILEMVCLPESWLDRLLIRFRRCNLGAQWVLARLTRGEPGGMAGAECTTPRRSCCARDS